MIRLDHHTSPLSPNPKQSPEHKIIPWDDAHFAVPVDELAHDSTTNDKQQQPQNLMSPPSPDGNSASPTGERSSSLSPVPPLAEEKEADVEIPQREEEEEEGSSPAEPAPPRDEKPDESRQSTPLSELSPAPDQDEELNGDDGEGGTDADMPENAAENESKEKPPPEADQKPVEHAQSPPTQPEPMIRPNPPASPPASIGTPAPSTPTISSTIPSSNNLTQDPKVVAILELNVELLKVCMLFQSKSMPTTDPRFQQYANRLQSNLTWLAAAADHGRQGNQNTMALPILDAPPSIGDSLGVDRIRQIYTDLPSLFAKDVARRQQLGLIGPSPSSGLPATPTNSTPISAASAHPTSTSNPGTPVIGGTQSNHPLKRERPQEHISADGLMNKRRDTGEGKTNTPTSGPSSMMPPPSSIPISSSTSGSGNPQFSASSPAAGSTGMNGNVHSLSQGMQNPQQPGQQSQQHLQHHNQPPQRPSSSASSPSGPGQSQQSLDAGLNLTGIGINPSEAQAAASARERARQTQIRAAQQHAQMRGTAGAGGLGNMPGVPGGVGVGSMGMDGVQGRPGMSMQQQQQMQQHRMMQMQQAQQQQQAGGLTSGGTSMAGIDGVGLPGSGNASAGGSMSGMGPSSGMPNGMGGMSGGGGGLMGGPGGMGGPVGMRGGMSSASAPNPQQQQQAQQQAYQILNTPNHPILRYVNQSVPGFENLPMPQQIQRIIFAKSHIQRQQELQRGEGQMQQQAQLAAMGRGPTNAMQNAQQMQQQMGGAGGGMSMPQQLQQNQNAGSSGFHASSGMNGPISPVQQQSMAQNQQNAMFGMGSTSMQSLGGMMVGGQSVGGGGGGMGGSGNGMSGGGAGGNMSAGGMGMGGIGSMDPRMMAGNMAGSGMAMGGGGAGGAPGNLTSHQQQRQLLLMQQQRAGGNVGMPMGGGPGPGGMGAGGGGGGGMGMNQAQFANMGGGHVSGMMQQQILQERLRQQQAAQMGASSPTHGGSPMGSETGFPGASAGSSVRSASAIPGIARSTRSPSDSGPSPLTPRGPQQRGSMTQEDYQRLMQQQQHNQAVRAMSSQSPAFNQNMMGSSQQQVQMLAQQQLQHQQQQQLQQQHQAGAHFGMSPPPSSNSASFGGGINAPSPTNSQNWGTPHLGSSYPFAPSPATSDHPRHMSATPAPQQQLQITPQNTPPVDQIMPSEFDIFNWNA